MFKLEREEIATHLAQFVFFPVIFFFVPLKTLKKVPMKNEIGRGKNEKSAREK